jgi:YfiH family protein
MVEFMEKVPHQTAEILIHSGIVHGFFGRAGGVSQGIYASLNACFHKGDEDSNIHENRRRIGNTMGISHMVTLRQVHKNDVLVVDADTPNGYQMDAMVTKTSGRLLAIQTADCAPVLLADPVARVVGGIHAGWRSAVTGIIQTTIEAMQNLGAKKENINAVIGPCIHQVSYEVGQEVFDAAKAPKFFMPSNRAGYYLFDLGGYVMNDLNNQKLNHVAVLPLNTYTLEDQYFSYRRSSHRQDPSCGGQLSVIGLTT